MREARTMCEDKDREIGMYKQHVDEETSKVNVLYATVTCTGCICYTVQFLRGILRTYTASTVPYSLVNFS